MATEEQIKRLTVEARTVGVAEAARQVDSIAEAQRHVAQASDAAAGATDRSEKTIQRAGQAYDRLIRTIDPVARATASYERDLKVLNRAMEQGVIQAEQYSRANDLLRARSPNIFAGPQTNPYAADIAAANAERAAAERQKLYDVSFGIGGASKSAAEAAAVFEAQFRAQEELAASAARLKASTDPLGTAQAALNAQIAEASRLFEAGALSASEYATAQATLATRLEEVRAKQAAAGNPFASDIAAANAERAAAQHQSFYNGVLGVDGASKSAADSAALFEAAARATADMERKVADLRSQIDPLGTLQAKVNAQLAEYRGFAEQGAISTAELANAEALAARHLQEMERTLAQTGGPLGKAGETAKLTAYEMTNLGMQMNDAITMLAMGAKPFQILASQGGQVYQVLSMSSGGVGGAMQALMALVTPLRVGIAGMAGAVALGVKSWWDYQDAVIEARGAMVGVAAISGSTQTSFMALSERIASANQISVGSARQMALAFAQTGKASEVMIGAVLANVRNYAATVGTDVATGGAELAKAFADPARGAEELNSKLGFLDDKTRHYIQTLAESGDRQSAQAALLRAMVPSLDEAANHVNGLAAAWDYVTAAASKAYTATGKAISAALPGASAGSDWQAQIDVLMREREGLAKRQSGTMFGNATLEELLPGANDKRAREIDEQIAWYRRQMAAEKVAADEKARQVDLNQRSLGVGSSARSLIPGYATYERLQNEQAAAQKLLADPDGRLKVDIDKVTEAMERRANALKSMTDATGRFITPAENQAEILRVQSRMELHRKNPAALARDQAELERLSLYGQTLTDRERNGLIGAASSRGVNALGQQRGESWTNALKDFDKATEQQRLAQNAAGLGAEALARLRAETELNASAMKIYGVDSVEALDRIDAKIRQQIELKASQRAADAALAEQRTNLFQAESLLASSMTDGITGLLSRTESARDALRSLVNSLLQATVQATLLGQGPLAGLFGTASASPTQVGGLFGSMFKGFSGFFAGGGDIPANGWGIAGEAGAEVIKGPASVVPLGKLASGGSAGNVFAPVTHLTVQSSGDPAADASMARTVGAAIDRAMEAHMAKFVEAQTRARGVFSRRTVEA